MAQNMRLLMTRSCGASCFSTQNPQRSFSCKSEPAKASTQASRLRLRAKQIGHIESFPEIYPDFLQSPVWNRRIALKEELERRDMLDRRMNIDIPEFYVGSIVAVTSSDPNLGSKEHRFVGICIRREKEGLHHQFTLRNTIEGIGVEIMYDLYNPTIKKIETLKLEKRLDTDLSYLVDSLPEYSTFDFHMEPLAHPAGTPIPVNETKVRLKNPPWTRRWELLGCKGIEDAWTQATPWFKRKLHKTKMNDYEKYDLIATYRTESTLEHELKDLALRVHRWEEAVLVDGCWSVNKCFISDLYGYFNVMGPEAEADPDAKFEDSPESGLNGGTAVESRKRRGGPQKLVRPKIPNLQTILQSSEAVVQQTTEEAPSSEPIRKAGKSRQRTTSEFVEFLKSHSQRNFSRPSTPTLLNRSHRRRNLSLSDVGAPRPRGLLGSFTESALNDRLEPVLQLDGFILQLTASGPAFSSPHTTLPVRVFFFDLNTTGDGVFPSAPVPFLGKCSLESFGTHGYRVPRKGNIQATLFNPQNTVVKMFLTNYDVEDMPSHARTFIRHVWRWEVAAKTDNHNTNHLAHLIHFRLLTDRKGRVYLHTDVRVLFSQNATREALQLPTAAQLNELSSVDGKSSEGYQLRDHVEFPTQPRYSPIK
ncbi:unnamed protein product [Caenorhabditis auriculariae]|uniref:Large ribosomal subunit protein bL19m n=1 Tax=Caenorhabditis auriculariae TaxID=2777116 RepID=A0A8S1GMJ9_9PELO|nr:unnamed protein product [Caenorhabditis auriculariae]